MATEASVVIVDPLGGLILDPSNELRFKGPFDDYVTVALTIRNPTEKRVAFKIKTTAPKRYCVKPNSGVLHSNQTIKVNVLLQPFNYDPNEKNKHKFMVQYLYLTEQEMQMDVNDILNMWKDVPANRLMDMKLKCIFEFTEEEQQRLQNLRQVSDAPSNTSQQNATLANASGQKSTSSTNKQPSASSNSSRQDVYSSADTHANDFESMTSLNTNAGTNINTTTTTTASAAAAAANSRSGALAAAGIAKTTTSGSSQADSKNENTLNELKFYKQENEALKKEVNRLKEEELRLRKLALQAPSRPSTATAEASSLSDLLNNRLVLIIIILIAIIVYLLLFR